MLNQLQKFDFVEDPSDYSDLDPDAWVVRIREGTSGKDQLLSLLREELHLPGYFGFNWDALGECLRDLSWLSGKRVVIVHESVPQLEQPELCIYLDILSYSIEDWKRDEEHELVAIFPVGAYRDLLRVAES